MTKVKTQDIYRVKGTQSEFLNAIFITVLLLCGIVYTRYIPFAVFLIHFPIMTYRYIWPWVKEYSMNHDSYFCEDFPNTRPFPVKRKEKQPNNYAGAGSDDHIVTEECPLACRPKNHPDWILC